MPDIHAIGLDLSPSEHSLSYPGRLVTSNCLLPGSWLYVLQPIPGLNAAKLAGVNDLNASYFRRSVLHEMILART
jgi:hypothetical protein